MQVSSFATNLLAHLENEVRLLQTSLRSPHYVKIILSSVYDKTPQTGSGNRSKIGFSVGDRLPQRDAASRGPSAMAGPLVTEGVQTGLTENRKTPQDVARRRKIAHADRRKTPILTKRLCAIACFIRQCMN